MNLFKIFICCTFGLLFSLSAMAQKMKGKVYDVDGMKPLEGVIIHNIFTEDVVYSDKYGKFEIEVKPGELVEFNQLNYKTVRIRIHGKPASYYDVPMVIGPFELEGLTIYGRDANRKIDSIKTAEVFQKALRTPKLTGMDAFQHPFSALSKENRRIWAFQERYYRTEQEKYIEYVFNPELIQKLTALGTDSVEVYRRHFRPSYDYLINWNEYDYYLYIKSSVDVFRRDAAYYWQERK